MLNRVKDQVQIVEFGPKADMALVDGFAFLDDCQFDAFHEGIRLQKSIATHKNRFAE